MSEIPEITQEEMQMLATARASFSTFISAYFLNLPDEKFVQQLRSKEFTQTLLNIQVEENLHPDTVEGARLMYQYLVENSHMEPKALSEALGVDRTRLYRGVSPAYGPPPPYEAVWGAGQEKTTALLQEITAIYHQSGLGQSPDANERLDYIGIELAFVEQLAQEEAVAWESGDEPLARDLLARQKAFLLDHLANWVPDFIEKAQDFAKTDFYRGHLLMLRGFIIEQQEILGEL